MRHALKTLAATILLTACASAPEPPPPPATGPGIACHAGAYELPDHRHLVLSPTADREGHVNGLRSVWIESGEQGRVAAVEGGGWQIRQPSRAGEVETIGIAFGACGARTLSLTRTGAQPVAARHLDLRATETTLTSRGATLRGVLVLPPSGRTDRVVVHVHGAERTSDVSFGRWRSIWPALGIAVFIYDKRGTGQSQGQYTQDFDLLADDAAAAMAQARTMLGRGRHEIGFFGTSQGGWVAPLAATRAHADFVLVGYGMAHGPLVEDQEEVQQDLRDAGFSGDVLTQAREITDATALGVGSAFARGLPEIAAVKARYAHEPWFSAVHGEYTGDVLAAPLEQLPALFRQRDVGTSWNYDPAPTLRAISTPMLWVLAGDDHEAPSALTVQILAGLKPHLPNLNVVVFPHADHEIQDFAQIAGRRVEVGYEAGYLPMLANWVRTKRVDLGGTNAEAR